MADQLKSFKKDWQRWSAAERASAIMLLAVAAALLGGPISLGLF